jgi:hypothetical protein
MHPGRVRTTADRAPLRILGCAVVTIAIGYFYKVLTESILIPHKNYFVALT